MIRTLPLILLFACSPGPGADHVTPCGLRAFGTDGIGLDDAEQRIRDVFSQQRLVTSKEMCQAVNGWALQTGHSYQTQAGLIIVPNHSWLQNSGLAHEYVHVLEFNRLLGDTSCSREELEAARSKGLDELQAQYHCHWERLGIWSTVQLAGPE